MPALHRPWSPGSKAVTLSFGLCSAATVFSPRFLSGIMVIFLLSSPHIHLALNQTVCIRHLFKRIVRNLFHCGHGKTGMEEDVLFSFQFPYPSQCFCPVHADFFCLIEGLFIDNGRIVSNFKVLLIPKHPAGAPVVQL